MAEMHTPRRGHSAPTSCATDALLLLSLLDPMHVCLILEQEVTDPSECVKRALFTVNNLFAIT